MELRKKWTPTQIAANAAFHARRSRGLTQDAAVEELAPWLGLSRPWRKANLSALEAQRLPRDTRHRDIDVETVLAMAYVYNVSPLSFFIPPDEAEAVLVGNEERSPIEVRVPLCGLLALEDIRMATARYGGRQIVDDAEEKLRETFGLREES